MARTDEWQVTINVECRGPMFQDDAGRIRPEYGLIDVLEGIITDIKDGAMIEEMHGQRLVAMDGITNIGHIIVFDPKVLSLMRKTEGE